MVPVVPAITVGDIFKQKITVSVLKEGGEKYTNDPDDRGGPTKWGITQARARLAGYKGDMRDMSYDTAFSIYQLMFWTQPGFDRVCIQSAELAGFMLDVGITRGPSVPSKWLQRFLNVNNAGGQYWPDLYVDGQIGVGTLTCLGDYLNLRRAQDGLPILLFAMRAFAAIEYIQIAEHDPTQEKFEFGWLAQRAFG